MEGNTLVPGWPSIADFLDFHLKGSPLDAANRKVFETYYASYIRHFSPYMRHHFVEQTREATQLIRMGAHRVLEVGAGCGTESLWFALQGADVTAIDVTADRLAVARARLDHLRRHVGAPLLATFIEGSFFDIDARQPFDLIWMEQTFHHLEPRELVYKKLLGLLRPGGHCVICEVNAWNPMLQTEFFLKRGFKTKTSFVNDRGERIEYGNERITTPLALRRGLRKAGFEIISTHPFRLLPNVFDPPLKWLELERAILRAVPILSTHYVLVARKPIRPISGVADVK